MYEFEYEAPLSVEDARGLLKEHEGGKILAGGMSLLSAMKLRLNSPSHLIDLRKIADLKGIERAGNELVIGAMTRHADVAASGVVRSCIPALAELAGGIGDRQVRNRGTIGGSMANSDPAACYPAGLMGIGGVVETNLRRIDAESFFKGLFETALGADELIRCIRFQIPKRAAYIKHKQSASRFALVGVMAVQTQTGGFRIGVTGAKSHAYRETLIEAELQKHGALANVRSVQLPPDDYNGDMHADPEYRKHLVLEIAARAVEEMFKLP